MRGVASKTVLNCTLLTGEGCEQDGLAGQDFFLFIEVSYRGDSEIVYMTFEDHDTVLHFLYVFPILRTCSHSDFSTSHYFENRHFYVSVNIPLNVLM